MAPCYKETNGAGGSDAFARGYGKPPAHSRFTPGQSGNPKGRPKGARKRAAAPGHQENRLQSIILDEAYRGVPVNDGKRQVTIPMAQAVVRSLAVNAAKGSQRAQRLFTTLITSTERERRKARECELEGAITYKVAWERELERRRRLGIIAEDPPSPPRRHRHRRWRWNGGHQGPATKEEKVLWEIWTEQQTTFENDLRELLDYLEDPDATERGEALKDVAKLTECLKIVRLALSGSRPVLRFLKSVSDSIADDHG